MPRRSYFIYLKEVETEILKALTCSYKKKKKKKEKKLL